MLRCKDKLIGTTHGSYERIIMLEKCGRLDLTFLSARKRQLALLFSDRFFFPC